MSAPNRQEYRHPRHDDRDRNQQRALAHRPNPYLKGGDPDIAGDHTDVKINVPLVPPNPNELDKTAEIGTSRASWGT